MSVNGSSAEFISVTDSEGTFKYLMVSIFLSSLLSQLLSVTTPGSSRGVEDQTDLLGVTTERSKSIKHVLLTRDCDSM